MRLVSRVMLVGALLRFSLPATAQQSSSSLADLHHDKGLSCAACHKEQVPKVAVPDQVCIDCHGGQAAIIARTNDYQPNPHVSPHTAELQCSTCHHAHKPMEISCLGCHSDKTFVKQSSQP